MRIELLGADDPRIVTIHETLLVPNFRDSDDLDSPENISSYLAANGKSSEFGTRYYVAVAIEDDAKIVGTSLFALFAHPEFRLMKAEYTAVLPQSRGCGVASALCSERVRISDQDAKQLAGKPLDFTLINLHPGPGRSVTDETSSLWFRLGFRLIDFDFVQLPLSDHQKSCRALLGFCGYTERFRDRANLSADEMKQILYDCNYFRCSYESVSSFPEYRSMLIALERRRCIPLI
jgi:hypothetical protein